MSDIRIRGLRKSYGTGAPVIDDLDLTVEEGEFVTLLGPSGCGKTTTLRCLAGLEEASGGEIWIGDRLVTAPQQRVFVPPHKRHIGLVFQNYALWPHMTVQQNVEYPLKIRRTPRRERATQVSDMLEKVGLHHLAKRPATLLSGGQQQRVALVRAMVGSPELLLFDEPLSNLDALLRISMRQEIRAAHDAAWVASLFVTHDQEEATVLSDRILVMREGRIEQQGAPREIFRHPRSVYVARFIGFENLLPARVVSASHDVATVAFDDGQQIKVHATPHTTEGARVVIAARAGDLRLVSAENAESADSVERADRSRSIRAQLTSFLYAGDELHYGLQLGPEKMRVVRPDDDPEHDLARTPGEQNEAAIIEFDRDRLVVLPPEQ